MVWKFPRAKAFTKEICHSITFLVTFLVKRMRGRENDECLPSFEYCYCISRCGGRIAVRVNSDGQLWLNLIKSVVLNMMVVNGWFTNSDHFVGCKGDKF